jgi:deoxyribodipyrimidine photo-lyase
MVKKQVNVFWFRRDLRLEDNVGLFHALKEHLPVLLLYIFDSEIFDSLPSDDPRVNFIYQRLSHIQDRLESHNSGILVKRGDPLALFKALASTYTINKVYCNHEYEPYAINRDKQLQASMRTYGVDLVCFKDQVIFDPEEILKPDGSPYKVYTPYSRKWLECLKVDDYRAYNSQDLLDNIYTERFEFPELAVLGFKGSDIKVVPYELSAELIQNYASTRNYPGLDGTSKLSPHLRYGTVSIRECVRQALPVPDKTFLKELIWRSFFIQVLWHYPESATQNFKSKYDGLEWRSDEGDFLAWCNGTTGYPLVDAGMRELNTTGYMHNRVRMVAASFLCKHLLIDWRLGEAYFAGKLLDFDLAQNVGNWQWVAGTGCDAAPYFRIFNPTEQLKKFDKSLTYVKKWVPEFQELHYPGPIIPHKEARERCLSAFRNIS